MNTHINIHTFVEIDTHIYIYNTLLGTYIYAYDHE